MARHILEVLSQESEQVISQRANVVRGLSLRHNREVYPPPSSLRPKRGGGIPVHYYYDRKMRSILHGSTKVSLKIRMETLYRRTSFFILIQATPPNGNHYLFILSMFSFLAAKVLLFTFASRFLQGFQK